MSAIAASEGSSNDLRTWVQELQTTGMDSATDVPANLTGVLQEIAETGQISHPWPLVHVLVLVKLRIAFDDFQRDVAYPEVAGQTFAERRSQLLELASSFNEGSVRWPFSHSPMLSLSLSLR